jgi:hypothetical protein
MSASPSLPFTVISAPAITTNGSPVQIIVTGDANPLSNGAWCLMRLFRGSTAVGQVVQAESTTANVNVPYCIQFVDAVAAGTYTYSMKVVSGSGSFAFGEATGPVITVTELQNVIGDRGYTGSSGTNGYTGSKGSDGVIGYTGSTGSWTLSTGPNTVSFTVTPGNSYTMWVNGNIPNGIVMWNATVSLSNTNVAAVGTQYGYYYLAGNALVLTSIPNQIVGTAGAIVTTAYGGATSNVFTFGITNNSGSSQVVYWGYVKI